MSKVVYLLGAGASANRIPVVNKMKDDIQEVIKDFYLHKRNIETEILRFNSGESVETIDKIINDLEYLHTACNSYSSIDTFAKKLFLTDSASYNRLKILLSFYFTYKQIKDFPDLRYDNFWASILNKPNELPSNIKIISWNYDFQLEQSFINMTNSENLMSSAKSINLYSHGSTNELDINKFSLIKINGSAQFYDSQIKSSYYMCEGKSFFPTNLKELIKNYNVVDNDNRYQCLLKFGWEDKNNIKLFNHFEKMLLETAAIAIIGYSFPFFNRTIDNKILTSLPRHAKIYIQDKNPNAIRQRIEQIITKPHSFVLVDDLSQFVFPMEL